MRACVCADCFERHITQGKEELFLFASSHQLVEQAALCGALGRHRCRDKCLSINKMMAPAPCQHGSPMNHSPRCSASQGHQGPQPRGSHSSGKLQ